MSCGGNPAIVRWVKDVCKKQHLSAFYIPRKDTYLIHFKGKALQGFNSKVFYQMPQKAREDSLRGILKRGLMLNFNEANRDRLYTRRRLGKEIVS